MSFFTTTIPENVSFEIWVTLVEPPKLSNLQKSVSLGLSTTFQNIYDWFNIYMNKFQTLTKVPYENFTNENLSWSHVYFDFFFYIYYRNLEGDTRTQTGKRIIYARTKDNFYCMSNHTFTNQKFEIHTCIRDRLKNTYPNSYCMPKYTLTNKNFEIYV